VDVRESRGSGWGRVLAAAATVGAVGRGEGGEGPRGLL